MRKKGEIETPIDVSEVDEGFFIELYCGQYCKEQTFAGSTKEEVLAKAESEEWVNLDSESTGTSGFWCGCDYLED